MKDHSGCRKAFMHLSKAWYASSVYHEYDKHTDEIMFGMYAPNGGGTSGEMAMRWHELGSERAPRLEVYCDAWDALALFTDLIQELGKLDDQNITPDEFIGLLLSLGFVDDTEYEQSKR